MALRTGFAVVAPVLAITAVVTGLLGRSSASGVQYSVGDSLWTIPPYPNYFSNWSSSHYFKIGDSLVFEFETGRYDVIQVSKLDYDLCTVWNPIRIFYGGPAIVQLNEPGLFYFICNFSNYCDLGLRMAVTVHRARPEPYPPSPSPSPPQNPGPELPTPAPAPSFGRGGSDRDNSPSGQKSTAAAARIGFGCVLFVGLSSVIVRVLELV